MTESEHWREQMDRVLEQIKKEKMWAILSNKHVVLGQQNLCQEVLLPSGGDCTLKEMK